MTVNNDPSLTLTPASIVDSAWPQESKKWVVTAHANTNFAGTVNVGIVDAKGVIDSRTVIVRQTDAYSYLAFLHTSALLAPGTYDGVIEVRLCHDDPVNCQQPYPGSPWKLPYHFEMKAPVLSALQPLPSGADWTNFQGNAGHSGYVPATLDVSKFSQRFVWPTVNPYTTVSFVGGLSRLTTQNGGVFFSDNLNSPYPHNAIKRVYAIDEASGSSKWGTAIETTPTWTPMADSLRAPVVANGNVYVTDGYTDAVATSDTVFSSIWTLSQTDGRNIALAYRPQVLAGELIADGSNIYGTGKYASTASYFNGDSPYSGYSFGVYKLNASGKALAWFTPYNAWIDVNPLAAIDSGYVYSYRTSNRPLTGSGYNVSPDPSSGLAISDKITGSYLGTIADDISSLPASGQRIFYGAPVICGASKIALALDSRGRLSAFDLSKQTRAWTMINSSFYGTPVCGTDTLYIYSGAGIEAHRISDGSLLWSWSSPNTYVTTSDYLGVRNLILTDNLLFIADGPQTHAVDLNTHQRVWFYDTGGELALSHNGILYIKNDSAIHAINLH